MADYLLYDVKVSLLSPLHIGSGHTLLHEYDYVVHGRKTWRIDERALLDAAISDDLSIAAQLARTKPAQLLKQSDFQPGSPLFRYIIGGVPRSRAEGAELNEQIKDSYDRPYLPGTSLKGALRTALAWHAWAENGLQPDADRLGRSRKFADRSYTRELFGQNPNEDWLRALHVSDSQPVTHDQLTLLNARVYNRRGRLASPIELEALKGDTQFQLGLKLDQVLFSAWASRAGLRREGAPWLRDMSAVLRQYANDRLRGEAAWFAEDQHARRISRFYEQLLQIESGLKDDQFFLQLGWGTGWDDKTFGSRLQADKQFMDQVINRYRLSRGRRQPSDPFPASRRLAVSFTRNERGQTQETPLAPLGWCLVEMKERGR